MVKYWIESIIFLLAALGALLIGFESLSNNVTKLFHKGLKSLFNKTANNNIIGVGIGAATTAIMQSSAATTVMVVGFVNTGLLNLTQATSIIMGANIGTTITAQLASLSSFDFGSYAIIFAAVGVFITMFAKKDRTKTLGNAISGFGLLFLGLKCVSLALNMEYNGVQLIKESIGVLLSNINGWYAPIVLFLLGIILTALCHSSALITTIIITLSASGIFIGSGPNTFYLTNNVLYLILGTNIGTCVTAMISSIGASTNAKRASFIHLLFNTFGALLFIILFIVFPHFMENTLVNWFKDNPAVQIAMFHTGFNVMCTIVFLPFIKIFVKLSEKLIKDKKSDNEVELRFIDERLIQSPSIATHQVRKELSHIYNISKETLFTALDGFINLNEDTKELVDKNNLILQDANKQIIDYMVKLSTNKLSYDDECSISSFYKTLHDIVRIGEIGDNICKYTKKMIDEELSFKEDIMVELGLFKNKIIELFEITDSVFATKDRLKIKDVDVIEEEIDLMRKTLVEEHYERLAKGECVQNNNGVFVNLVNNLERAADHMTYIAHSVEDAYIQSTSE